MSLPHVCVCEKCRREMGESLAAPLWQTFQELKLAEEGLANYQQEVNGLLVENSNLRGVRDQLLKDDGETIERLQQEVQDLKRSLNFWLPMIPEDAPLDENACLSRIERDARLLFEYDGEADEQCATELGWVSLRLPQTGEQP